jgi:hypothetical protein
MLSSTHSIEQDYEDTREYLLSQDGSHEQLSNLKSAYEKALENNHLESVLHKALESSFAIVKTLDPEYQIGIEHDYERVIHLYHKKHVILAELAKL